MKNFKGRGYHQSGVSMIEVLIAILISVIGLFSVTKMQLNAVSNTHSAYLRSQAAVSANAMVDQLRANSSAALNGDYDLALTASAPTSGGLEVADLPSGDLIWPQYCPLVLAPLPVSQQLRPVI